LESRDYQNYLDLISDDIVYHAAGNCFFSGDYHGKEKMSQLAKTIYAETKGTHRVVRRHIIATATHAAVIDTWSAQRKGQSITMDNMLVYRIANEKVAEVWEYIENVTAHDAFWAL